MRTCVRPLPCILLLLATRAGAQAPLDTLTLGTSDSEQSHHFTATQSSTAPGGLQEPARMLVPLDPQSWEGGKMAFDMQVDPARPNYLTVRLWGSDVNPNLLFLFCDGKQVGYRHLGDIDKLDAGSDEPFCNGRFFYSTTPLPLELTRGKTQVRLEIRATGPIWSYGTTWEQYQKNMTQPTRGIYRVYTHTDAAFTPPAGEVQGAAIAQPPHRTSPGPEVLEALKQRVNNEIDARLRAPAPPNQMQMQFLARAYHIAWTHAFKNPKVVDQIVKGLDATYRAYMQDPTLAQSDPATPNADWFGLGPSGQVIALLPEQLKPLLEADIEDGRGGKIARRAGFSDMLLACREWHRRNRRQYSNQSMINDLYGIYLANRGLEILTPAKALPEADIRRYLYESLGLQPWLGSDDAQGRPTRSLGENYFQLTTKGLTKELGYVGYYGEVIDWVTAIYDATRPTLGGSEPGDPKIRQALINIAQARSAFRYPMLDAQGNNAMRIETIVGWRDVHFPGNVTYVQRPTWDGTPLDAVAATLDPALVGMAQQMLDDNEYFASLAEQMQEKGFRTTAGLLGAPDGYRVLLAQPQASHRLPMGWDQADFTFADEEDGVVAVKHGREIFYASLYWRARYAVNFLARVHAITPQYDRIAVVRQEEEFVPSGLTYTRPDWTNFDFANGGLKYPGDLHSAHTGEKLPIAQIPAGVRFRPGDESPYAGRASFYKLRYGRYLIGMNASRDQTFELAIPPGPAAAAELVSRKELPAGGTLKVPPSSTAILYLAE